MDPKNDATLNEGVPQQEQQSTDNLPSLVDRRAELINSIVKSVDANRAEEMGEEPAAESGEEAQGAEKPPENAGEEKGAAPAPEKKKSKADPGKPEAEEPREKLVIDGHEQEVPRSKIFDAGKRALQKELAADKRLEEATRLLKEAKETNKGKPPEPGAAPEKSPAKTDADKEQLRDALKAIRYGSDEEAEAAFGRVVKSPAEKAPDLNEVLHQVEVRTAAKDVITRFAKPPEEGGFSDIHNDPYLRHLAALRVDELIREGKSAIDWNTYDEAGKFVRERFGNKASSAPSEDPNKDLAKKSERKKGIDNVTSAAGRAPLPKTEDATTPKTPSEVIAAIKKARVGQG